jgi:hypothetical protein
MFRVVLPPIIRNAYNCIYSIWYLSHRYCYLPLSWKSWNRFAPPTAVTVWQIPDAVDTVVCAPDDEWKYHPKHVEQFPGINNLCNIASCWIYIWILLGAYSVPHISRIRVNANYYYINMLGHWPGQSEYSQHSPRVVNKRAEKHSCDCRNTKSLPPSFFSYYLTRLPTARSM